MRNIIIALALAIVFYLASGGCYVAAHGSGYGPAQTEVVVYRDPAVYPHPRSAPTPRQNQVWIEGYWEWGGAQWVWREGYWESVRVNEIWVPGTIVVIGGRSRWTPGCLFYPYPSPQ